MSSKRYPLLRTSLVRYAAAPYDVSRMAEILSITLSDEQRRQLADAIASGRYPDEASALQAGLDYVLGEPAGDHERVADEYRRAYARHPQEAWIGELGGRLLAEHLARKDDSTS